MRIDKDPRSLETSSEVRREISMFVYVYRFDVKSGMESAFRERWKAFTKLIHLERGSLGSRLHVDLTGNHIAYAQWPTKEIALQNATYSDDY